MFFFTDIGNTSFIGKATSKYIAINISQFSNNFVDPDDIVQPRLFQGPCAKLHSRLEDFTPFDLDFDYGRAIGKSSEDYNRYIRYISAKKKPQQFFKLKDLGTPSR